MIKHIKFDIPLLIFTIFVFGCASSEKNIYRDSISHFNIKDSLAMDGKCVIMGKITDINTNQPLEGTEIVILSSQIGVRANIDGNYTISDIDPGIYNIEARYIGYNNITVSNIKLISRQIIELNFELAQQDLRNAIPITTQ